MKKLIGRTDLEDALNRLDKLTHEHAQMAAAEVQKVTLTFDETARGVTEQAVVADNRVVGENDKIADVINGAQIGISQAGEMFDLNHLDGKEVKRLSSPDVLSTAPLPSARPLSPNEREQSELSLTGQPMSSTTNFQLIVDALAEYTKITGIDLSKSSFASTLEQSNSPEAVLELLEGREKAFREYRDNNRILINCLSPAVKILQAFSGILGEAASLVSVQALHIPLRIF